LSKARIGDECGSFSRVRLLEVPLCVPSDVVPLARASLHHDQFSRFCTVRRRCDQHTDIRLTDAQTTERATCVAIARIEHCSQYWRCGLNSYFVHTNILYLNLYLPSIITTNFSLYPKCLTFIAYCLPNIIKTLILHSIK